MVMAERLVLHDDILVVAALLVEESLLELLGVVLRIGALLVHHPLHGIPHASFEHHQCEERHHIGRKVAALDAGGKQQVGHCPNVTLVVHDVTHRLGV